MKFKDYYKKAIESETEFDVIAGGCELEFTVCPGELTEEGYEYFDKMFASEVKVYDNDVCEFVDDSITGLVELFVSAQAGYISFEKYDKWFK